VALCTLALALGTAREGAAQQTIDAAHAQALRDYWSGRYELAADSLERLLGLRVESSHVHYNLGCAYFRLGRLGPAVYHFERALALDPGDEDARFNLETTRVQLTARVRDEIKGAAADPLWMRVVSLLGTRSATILFLALWWLGLGVLLALRFMARGAGRAALIAGESFVAACTLVAALLLAGRIYLEERVVQAIVLPDRAAVREGPDASAKSSFAVHAGLRVRLQARDERWARIRLANGLEGWLPARDLGVL
jgi:tetratricopeptide (TPR) repeat protein